jgi:hypothetical protein
MRLSACDVIDDIPLQLRWWRRGDDRQNFGDFLTVLLWRELCQTSIVDAQAIHLIGSVISEGWVKKGLADGPPGFQRQVVFWYCGCQEPKKPSDAALSFAQIRGVRGPLTRQVLGLPENTVLGDTGLLAPVIHQPSSHLTTTGRYLCIPHMSDPLPDLHLRQLSGADIVIRPVVENSLSSLRQLLDQIASARFVLAGSLHAAILAFAYGVPFAYFDSGFVSMPFKWRDFSASINAGTHFVDNVSDGEKVYSDFIAPRMRGPLLIPILEAAPFVVLPEKLMLARKLDSIDFNGIMQSVADKS